MAALKIIRRWERLVYGTQNCFEDKVSFGTTPFGDWQQPSFNPPINVKEEKYVLRCKSGLVKPCMEPEVSQ